MNETETLYIPYGNSHVVELELSTGNRACTDLGEAIEYAVNSMKKARSRAIHSKHYLHDLRQKGKFEISIYKELYRLDENGWQEGDPIDEEFVAVVSLAFEDRYYSDDIKIEYL